MSLLINFHAQVCHHKATSNYMLTADVNESGNGSMHISTYVYMYRSGSRWCEQPVENDDVCCDVVCKTYNYIHSHLCVVKNGTLYFKKIVTWSASDK